MRSLVLLVALTGSACMVQSQPQAAAPAATAGPGSVPGHYVAAVDGQRAELILAADGTGTIDGYPGTWTVQNGQLYLSDGQSWVPATLQGNQLVVHLPQGPVAFTRVAGGGGQPGAPAGGGYPASGGAQVGGTAPAAGAPPRHARPAGPARPFEPEQTVPGDPVTPEGGGATFTVPRGWQHGPTRSNDGTEAYGLQPPGGQSQGAVMITRLMLGAAEQQQPVSALLGQAMQELIGNVPVEPVVAAEELEIAGQRAARSIVRGTVNGQELELYMAGVVVDHYGFVIMGLYPTSAAGTMRPAIDTVLASFRGSVPAENTELKARLIGCWEDYTYSNSQAGTGSFSRRIGLQQDGTYWVRTYTSVDAGGATMSSDDREQGRYRVEGNTVVTMSEKGEPGSYQVQFQGGILYLAGNKHLPCSK